MLDRPLSFLETQARVEWGEETNSLATDYNLEGLSEPEFSPHLQMQKGKKTKQNNKHREEEGK